MNKKWFIYAGLAGVSFALLSFVFNRKSNPKGKTALIVGDSLSYDLNWGWAGKLARAYGFTIVKNLSKVGASTPYMVQALKTYLANNAAPDMVFIFGGTNDNFSGISNQTATQNIQSMVNMAAEKGVKDIYVISGYSAKKVTAPFNVARYANLIDSADSFRFGLKNKITGAKVVPVWTGADNTMSNDAIHLNSNAHTLLATYIGNYLFL